MNIRIVLWIQIKCSCEKKAMHRAYFNRSKPFKTQVREVKKTKCDPRRLGWRYRTISVLNANNFHDEVFRFGQVKSSTLRNNQLPRTNIYPRSKRPSRWTNLAELNTKLIYEIRVVLCVDVVGGSLLIVGARVVFQRRCVECLKLVVLLMSGLQHMFAPE